MSLDPNSIAVILELAKLGTALVRRHREANGENPDAPISAEEISRIRIRSADELIELGRSRFRDEEP